MAREFTIQMTMMRRMLTYVSQTVAASAGPAMKQIVKDSTEWLKVNRELIQLRLENFVNGVSMGFARFYDTLQKIYSALEQVIPGFSEFVNVMTSAESISTAVYTVLLTLAGVLVWMAGGWLLVAAAVGAVVLIIDDLITYFQGGESAIGALIEKTQELYQQFKETYPNIAKFAEQVWDILVKIGKWTGGEIVKAFKDLWEIVKVIADGLESIFGFMLKIVDKAMGFTLGDFLMGDWLVNEPGTGRAPMSPATQQNIQGPVVQQQPSSSSNTITINQNITGVNAPAIADETARETQQALINMVPGGLVPVTQ